MLELPPITNYDNNTISLLTEMKISGELKQINDEYLYWDK